jgi:protein O-mannosyl-transferase
MPGRGRAALAAAGIVAAALLAHGGGLRNGYAWDDGRLIAADATLRDASSAGRFFLSMDELPGYYRPLTRASFVLDGTLLELEPARSHAVEILLHATNALLLFLLALRLGLPLLAAAAAGGLLAVHPVNVEAVSLVVARNNLLALSFGLLATLCLLSALARRSRVLALGSAFFSLAATLSKEPGFLFLPLLGWLAAARLREERPAGQRLRPWLWLALPQAAACLLALGLRWQVLGTVGAPAGAEPLSHRALQAVRALAADARLFAWPAGLTIFHPVPSAPLGLALLFCCAVLLAAALGFARGGEAVRFGILLAALQWLPVSGLVPTASALVAERYLYLPGAGLCLCAGALLGAAALRLAAARPGARVPATLAMAAAAVALGAASAKRTAQWRDDATLSDAALALDPRCLPALRNRAIAAREAGQLDEAVSLWQRALEVDPGDADSLGQLGTVAAMRGDYAAGEQRYRKALERPDASPLVHFNLGRLLELTGRPAEAAREYRMYIDTAVPGYGGRALVAEAGQRLARTLAASRNEGAKP